MKLQDAKDRLAHAVETENPPGTDYYGAELDEDEVEAARERIDKTIRMHEEATKEREPNTNPGGRTEGL
jgi:hypothetical protein